MAFRIQCGHRLHGPDGKPVADSSNAARLVRNSLCFSRGVHFNSPLSMKNPSSRIRRRATLLSALALAIFAAGCASTPVGLPKPLPDREARMKYGYLYYLDGAGGGTAKNNWAAGVREG